MAADLAGKAALILGGTRGIGAAISRRLAADGAAVAMIHLSRAEPAAALVAAIETTGARALAIRADIADTVALAAAIDRAIAALGRIDILVNSAGLAITGPLDAYPADAFDRVFAVNVRAPFLAARQVAPHMPDGGRIITIGSIVADRAPGAGVTLYAASKAALRGLTRGLARDLGPRGITANLVQPGPIDTERNPADGPNAADNRTPLAIDRHGRAEEVAGLVAWLASDEAAFVTGSVHNIDGGWSA
jgi:3-oxoacyl-[acyl-carrier protein] reductase